MKLRTEEENVCSVMDKMNVFEWNLRVSYLDSFTHKSFYCLRPKHLLVQMRKRTISILYVFVVTAC